MLQRLRRHDPADLVLWLAVPLSVVLLLFINRHQWFRGDDFELLVGRRRLWGSGNYIDALFLPHNEHWSTGLLAVFMGVFRLVRFSSYLPYLAVVYVFHVMLALAVRVVLLRAGYPRWLATAGTVSVLLLGSGEENLAWAFQIGFVGAVAMAMVSLVLSDHDGPLRWFDVFGAGLLLFALTFSGSGLTVMAVIAVNAVWHRRWRTAILYIGVVGALYGVWFLKWGHTAHREMVDVVAIQPYVYRGVTASIDGLTALGGTGAVVGVIVLLNLIWRGRDGRLNGLVVACAAGSVLFFVAGGVARGSLGTEQATSSRYVYLAAALLVPAVFGVLEDLLRVDRKAGRIAVAALVAWAIVGNVATGVVLARSITGQSNTLKARLAAVAALPSLAEVDQAVQVEATMNPDVDVAAVRDFVAHDQMELPATDQSAELVAASIVEVRASTGPGGDAGAATVTGLDGTVATPDERCLRLTNASGRVDVVLRSDQRTTVLFTDTHGPISVRLLGDNGLATQPSSLSTSPDSAGILLDHPDFPVEVTASSGSVLLCGARPAAGVSGG